MVLTVSIKYPEQAGLCRMLCGGCGRGAAWETWIWTVESEPESARVTACACEAEGASDFGGKSLSESVLPAFPWTTSCWFASSRLRGDALVPVEATKSEADGDGCSPAEFAADASRFCDR